MIMEDNTGYITTRIWNKILPPVLISNTVIMIAMYLGMYFLVSRFCPKQELVVYSSFLPFWILIAVFEYFFATAGPQYFSIFKGAGNHQDAQQFFAEVLTAQLLLVAAGSLLAICLMPWIVQFLGIPQDSVSFALRYGKLLLVCALMDVTTTMLRGFVQSDSLPKTGAVIASTQAVSLVLAMYICFCVLRRGLMAYYWTFLCITLCVNTLYLSLFLFKKTTLKLRFGWMHWQTFKNLVSLSNNNIISNIGCFILSMLTTRWLMLAFGPAAVTIFALLATLLSCCILLQNSFLSSAQLLFGVYRGEENNSGIRIVCRKALFSGLCFLTGCVVLLLCFPDWICREMNVMENFPGEAALAIRIFALSIPFEYTYCFFAGYYIICGYDKMMAVCSVIACIFLDFFVMAFFLLVLQNEQIFWWYDLVEWFFSIGTLFMIVLWKKRKGHFQDLLLLPQRKPTGKRYYFLLKNRTDDFQDYRTMLKAFLRKQSIEPENTIRINHLFEELFLFAGEQIGNRKNALFSIVVTIFDQDIELALRYDSRESCLKSVLNGKLATVLNPEQVAGAKILSRLSDSIYIDRIYGINYIRLTLNRNTSAEKAETTPGESVLLR